MRLDFKKIEIHSFMSFEDEVFEFDTRKGMVLVRGKNNDLPDEVNGSGKCLAPETLITVETDDVEIEKMLSSLNRKDSAF